MKKEGTSVSFFAQAHGKILLLLAILLAATALTGFYHFRQIKNAETVENVDFLSGQRIGCGVGWETDYLLTGREDITLLRYETNADCLLALQYRQIDALGLDAFTAAVFMSRTEGLEMLPGSIAQVGCTFYTSYGADAVLQDFNDFTEEFLQTAEYAEYYERAINTGDSYEMPLITPVENGKPLVVAYLPDCFPESYLDFTTGRPSGYGIEMIERFAAARGYTIEYVESSDTMINVLLAQNKIDLAASYISDVYREDTEAGGICHMTAPYLQAEVKLLRIAEGQELKVLGELD